jgi:hypothetical protein
MDELQINTTFLNISPENLDEFKRLAAEAVSKGETGTLRYDIFLSDDGTKCVMPHVQASSDALLTHMGNMGELPGPMAEQHLMPVDAADGPTAVSLWRSLGECDDAGGDGEPATRRSIQCRRPLRSRAELAGPCDRHL